LAASVRRHCSSSANRSISVRHQVFLRPLLLLRNHRKRHALLRSPAAQPAKTVANPLPPSLAPTLVRFKSEYADIMRSAAEYLAGKVRSPLDRVLVETDIRVLAYTANGRFLIEDGGGLASPKLVCLTPAGQVQFVQHVFSSSRKVRKRRSGTEKTVAACAQSGIADIDSTASLRQLHICSPIFTRHLLALLC
jgi:hypothetical protein